jgi:uncharacterized protein (TIGR00369 family)
MKELPRYPGCFVCGRDNPAGTGVTFLRTEDGVEAEYRADPRHQSYEGIVHGGVISALLDECMGWAVIVGRGRMHVTGELTVRYLRPLAVDTAVTVRASLDGDGDGGKSYRTARGLIQDDEGTVFAVATGKFFPIPREYEERVLEYLEFDDDPERSVMIEDICDHESVVGRGEAPHDGAPEGEGR